MAREAAVQTERLGQRIAFVALLLAAVALLTLAPGAGAATVWSIPGSISGTDTLAKGTTPSAAMDAEGDAEVAWTAASDGADDCPCSVRVAGRATPADLFGAPVTVSTPTSGTGAENAHVAMDSSGDAIVVWDDTSGGGAVGTSTGPKVWAALQTAGGSFGDPVEVSNTAQGGTDPAVGMDSNGDMVVAYRSKNSSGNGDVEAAFGPSGGPFGDPVSVSNDGDDVAACCGGNLSVSPDGHAAIGFNATNSTPQVQVEAATTPPGGPFGAPVTLATYNPGEPFLGGPVSFDSVAADDGGDAAVGYTGSTPPVGSGFSTEPTAEVTFSDEGAPFFFTGGLGGAPIAWGPVVALDASREGVALFAPGSAAGASTGLDAAVRLPGAGFRPTQTLSASGVNGQLAVSNDEGSDDTTLAAWVANGASAGDSMIQTAFRAPGGLFGTTGTVATATGQAPARQQLSDAVDAVGDGVIAWATGGGQIEATLSRPALPPGPISPSSSSSSSLSSSSSPSPPAVATTSARRSIVAQVRHLSARGTKVTFQLGCAGGGCRGTVSAITRVRGQVKLKRHGQRVTITKTVTVTLATRRFSLPAGVSRKFTLSLNKSGRQLLGKLETLAVGLQIKIGRSQWGTGKVTLHAPSRHSSPK